MTGEVTFHLTQVVLAKITLALRQYDRTQAALTSDHEMRQQLKFKSGTVPPEVQATTQELEDAAHFLVLALRQAVRAQWVVARQGVDVPPIRDSTQVMALRDLHEHWDRWAAEPYGLTDEPWRAMKAGAEWARLSPVRPEYSMGWAQRAEGGPVFTSFRGLELLPLIDDLRAVRQAVEQLAEDAFRRENLTLDEAADMVGPGRLLAVRSFTNLIARPDAEGTLRLNRIELVAAVARVEGMPGIRFSEDRADG